MHHIIYSYNYYPLCILVGNIVIESCRSIPQPAIILIKLKLKTIYPRWVHHKSADAPHKSQMSHIVSTINTN